MGAIANLMQVLRAIAQSEAAKELRDRAFKGIGEGAARVAEHDRVPGFISTSADLLATLLRPAAASGPTTCECAHPAEAVSTADRAPEPPRRGSGAPAPADDACRTCAQTRSPLEEPAAAASTPGPVAEPAAPKPRRVKAKPKAEKASSRKAKSSESGAGHKKQSGGKGKSAGKKLRDKGETLK